MLRTGRTDGCTDGWTDGQRENSISPLKLRFSGGYNKPPDESKTRTHRFSKLPDDGDPWAPNNLLTLEQKKSISWTALKKRNHHFSLNYRIIANAENRRVQFVVCNTSISTSQSGTSTYAGLLLYICRRNKATLIPHK